MNPKDLPRDVLSHILAQHPPPEPTVNPFAGLREIGRGQFTESFIGFAQARGWAVAHFRPARVKRGGRETYETPVAADGKGFLDLECVRERLIKVELKVRPNKPSADQLAWMERYQRAGIECHLFYPEDWRKIVEMLR